MLGPVMLDVASTDLSAEDRHRLADPLVGGVILFARNYESPSQLLRLTAGIRALRDPPLLIAADHEGGRVQRFRLGFTEIPPMRRLGTLWDEDAAAARQLAHGVGYIIGMELRSHGVDFSFAPVLDLDYGASGVIGDRALHSDPRIVAELALALTRGLGAAGVRAVGKHFPGHGYARADSHLETATDARSLAEIEGADLVPFARLAAELGGVMPAHVIYPAVDARPAGFSPRWLQEILRTRLGFRGVVFSDDLSMEAAKTEGGIAARTALALSAGCDMVLVCNAPETADELLGAFPAHAPRTAPQSLAMRAGANNQHPPSILADASYRDNLRLLAKFG
jgi:beta-N-acetylhexosaminidase